MDWQAWGENAGICSKSDRHKDDKISRQGLGENCVRGNYGSAGAKKEIWVASPYFPAFFCNLGLVFSNVLCYNSKRCYVRVTEK